MRQACLVMRVLSGSWASSSSCPALPLAGMAGGAPGLLNGLAMVVTVMGD